MFWQSACASYGLFRHSLTSLQTTPFPLNPDLHAQVNDPSRFEQVALALQSGVTLPPAAFSIKWLPTEGKRAEQGEVRARGPEE